MTIASYRTKPGSKSRKPAKAYYCRFPAYFLRQCTCIREPETCQLHTIAGNPGASRPPPLRPRKAPYLKGNIVNSRVRTLGRRCVSRRASLHPTLPRRTRTPCPHHFLVSLPPSIHLSSRIARTNHTYVAPSLAPCRVFLSDLSSGRVCPSCRDGSFRPGCAAQRRQCQCGKQA